MKAILVAALAVVLSGCAIVPVGHGPGTRRSSLSSGGAPQCKPSQYWDGATCRHKGKGHGARKHDG